jgi:hypothetical protein
MTIITALITSVIGSFLFGRFYLNLQYHKSNAGFRQQQIIDCTTDLIACYQKNGQIDQDLHIKYQYALSEVIEKLIITYGIDPAIQKDINENEFPAFTNEKLEDNIPFFKENIRPVMIDLNNNAFIGWINWVPNVKRLTTLWSLCFTLEELILNLDYLQAKQREVPNTMLSVKNGLLTVNDSKNYSKEIEKINKCHTTIKELWFNWITLNKLR